MAANVRDSDTSLWLHNKLGTSSEWTNGSICSQLNKEVLRNIKECFAELQTQVKLKLLLSFFHISRRLVEEWKTELDEIIEIAALDSELWVSMIAETMKSLPSTGSLNTEISDYDETRPIFIDMVNDLRKFVNKYSDLGMLPLECQYLNKTALTSVVGPQPTPVKHFTLKRKPKSATLRQELLQKSADAQSSLKKICAPTIPSRSRCIPRKLSDTTPLRGIPSRALSGGFRSPSTQIQSRPNIPRQPGRKDGGIKLLDINEQPLGYAAAKKRKRQQELEEQQKRLSESQMSTDEKSDSETPVETMPDYAAGLSSAPTFTQTVATSATSSVTKTNQIKSESSAETKTKIESEPVITSNSWANATKANDDVSSLSQAKTSTETSNQKDNEPQTIVVNQATVISKPTKKKSEHQKASIVNVNNSTIKTLSSNPPPLASINSPTTTIVNKATPQLLSTPQQPTTSAKKIVQIKTAPTIQVISSPTTVKRQITTQNIPPLVPAQQPTILNIQQGMSSNIIETQTAATNQQIHTQDTNHGLAQSQPSTIQIQPAQKYSSLVMAPNVNVKGKTIILANPGGVNQPKTIILRSVGPDGSTVYQQVPISSVSGLQTIGTNSNNMGTIFNTATGMVKTQTISAQQQPQFQNIQVNSTQQGMPALVPTSYQPVVIQSSNNATQILSGMQQTQMQQNQPQTIHVQQQPTQSNQTTIRPLIITNTQGVNILPQSLTLIQRPGQQAQIVQTVNSQGQHQQIQRTVIAQPTQQQQQQQPTILTQQHIRVQQQSSNQIPQLNQAQTTQIVSNNQIQKTIIKPQVQGQKKGLHLSNEHVAKLNEIFSRANCVTRRDKALILGFMGGCRENPMPSPENYIVIKLGESEELVKQEDGSITPMLVESLIKLDYNTGEWKKLQHLRRIDKSNISNESKKLVSQNSVVI